jgi:hypothetical protein
MVYTCSILFKISLFRVHAALLLSLNMEVGDYTFNVGSTMLVSALLIMKFIKPLSTDNRKLLDEVLNGWKEYVKERRRKTALRLKADQMWMGRIVR